MTDSALLHHSFPNEEPFYDAFSVKFILIIMQLKIRSSISNMEWICNLSTNAP